VSPLKCNSWMLFTCVILPTGRSCIGGCRSPLFSCRRSLLLPAGLLRLSSFLLDVRSWMPGACLTWLMPTWFWIPLFYLRWADRFYVPTWDILPAVKAVTVPCSGGCGGWYTDALLRQDYAIPPFLPARFAHFCTFNPAVDHRLRARIPYAYRLRGFVLHRGLLSCSPGAGYLVARACAQFCLPARCPGLLRGLPTHTTCLPAPYAPFWFFLYLYHSCSSLVLPCTGSLQFTGRFGCCTEQACRFYMLPCGSPGRVLGQFRDATVPGLPTPTGSWNLMNMIPTTDLHFPTCLCPAMPSPPVYHLRYL